MEKAEKKVLSQEERLRERERKREQGGLNNMIEVHLADLMDYAQENPFPVVSSPLLSLGELFTNLFVYCCLL
jgi:hypothetical protein